MNKKIIAAFAALSLCAGGSVGVIAEDDINVILDGQAVEFDVAPKIENDRTLVPLRAVFEALGANVFWDEKTQTIISGKENKVCVLQINNNIMIVNGENITLDVPAKIEDDRTLIPLRAVSEAYDCTVDWDGNTRTVTITSGTTEAGNQVSGSNEL